MTNRFNLPDIEILTKDPELIEASLLNIIDVEMGLTLENADPRRQWIKAATAFITLERNNLEHRIRQSLLTYAEDESLEHIGETNLTPKLKATAAKTTMEFNFEIERVSVVTLDAGSLFLVGENTYFENKETIVFPVGAGTFTVELECTEEGTIGNGYLPGEISTIVKPLPWLISVRNITKSDGGTDEETDDAYAQRIRLGEEKYSTAGPELAYEYHARSSNSSIVDVSVDSPAPNEIEVSVLLKDGEIPSQTVLDGVEEHLSAKKIRPMSDVVTAKAPEIVQYDAVTTYWISRENANMVNQIQSQVTAAYNEYLIWQKSKMGRDVDLSELVYRLKEAGATRVAITSTMYVQVPKGHVADEDEATLTFGGLSDA